MRKRRGDGGHNLAKELGWGYHRVRYYICNLAAPSESAAGFLQWYNDRIAAKAARSKSVAEAKMRRQCDRAKQRRATGGEWVNRHNQWRRENYAKRWQSDPQYRICKALRRRVAKVIELQRGVKSADTMSLIGCDWDALKAHIESQFAEGMSWANYGQWHIDHIVPCSHFDLTDRRHQRTCFNWQNLRPLWAEQNLSRNNRLERPTQVALPLSLLS